MFKTLENKRFKKDFCNHVPSGFKNTHPICVRHHCAPIACIVLMHRSLKTERSNWLCSMYEMVTFECEQT